MDELRPKNAGRRWTPAADARLLEAVREARAAGGAAADLTALAAELDRTRGAIVARLCMHAAARLAADPALARAMDALAAEHGVTASALEHHLAKQAAREAAAPRRAGAAGGGAGAGASAAAAAAAENAGAPWTADEDARLLAAIADGKEIAEAARDVGRSENAATRRLTTRAYDALGAGAAPDDAAIAAAAREHGLSPDGFAKYVAKRRAAEGAAAAKARAAPVAPRGAPGGGARPPADPLADLNGAQRAVVAAVRDGESVLLTGPAGTGKTHTVRAILADASRRGKRLGLTATTGAAAVLIGGRTVHSFLGIGLGRRPVRDLASYTVNRLKKHAARIAELDVLLIDEISMMPDALFTTISKYLSLLRKDPAPFGGVQMVLVGDFAQLPPVDGDFAFKSPEWARLSPKVHALTEIFRQAGDAAFQALLHRARLGAITDDDLARLRATRDVAFPAGFVPTRLYARNAMVAARNEASYERLKAADPSAEVIYAPRYANARSREWGPTTGHAEPVALCPDAQVMISWNVAPDEGLINGTRGRVVALQPSAVALQLLDGRVVTVGYTEIGPEDDKSLRMSFVPLRLAYAMSIHKSQGSTLDAAETDLGSSIFEAAQAYVALSRVRNLSCIRITDVLARSFRAHPEVVAFYEAGAAAAAAEAAAPSTSGRA